jgi:L-lactate dehydrogenase complex protein LldE
MRIALFTTCLVDTAYPAAAIAITAVLERLGHTIEVPSGQTCCGQMHHNSGYVADSTRLAERFVRDFAPYDVIVTPSASCAGMVRHMYPEHLGIDAPKVHEFTELLVDVLGVTDVGARLKGRAAYHPTCHSLRTLRLGDRPATLLRAVRDLTLVELPDAEQCCGFGGTFAVKNADVSAAMAADKAVAVESVDVDYLVTVDASCLMQIGTTLQRRCTPVRTLHLAEVLAAQ